MYDQEGSFNYSYVYCRVIGLGIKYSEGSPSIAEIYFHSCPTLCLGYGSKAILRYGMKRVSYGYHKSKVIYNLTNKYLYFQSSLKSGVYRPAYCRQNIRTGLKFLYAIITFLFTIFCLIYIHNITNLKHFNTVLNMRT